MIKHLLGRTHCFFVLGALALVTAPAQAVTSTGPYYAAPSWDRTLPAATRFLVLSNFEGAAVLDRNTGLVWEKSPDTTLTLWSNARYRCMNKVVGGQKGFRLPSFVELSSLVDPSVPFPGPALQPGHPFLNIQSTWYWAATTNFDFPTMAFGLYLRDGSLGIQQKIMEFGVWCVRGGMNADVY